MSVPINPSISTTHQFHHQIDQFVEDITKAVNSAQNNSGEANEEDMIKLAIDIERLEENANFVLRDGSTDEETIIDAQILLGVITQEFQPPSLGDREVTMLRAARDFKEKSSTDLKEIIKTFSENKEDREQLMLTINHISHDVYLRCDIENPEVTEEKKSA